MRAFVILALIAVAYARPDVSLGYNYEKAGSHHAYNHGLAPPSVGAASNNIPVIGLPAPAHHIPAPVQHISQPQQHIHQAPAQTYQPAPVQHTSQPAPVQQISHPASVQQISHPAPIQHIAPPAPVQNFQPAPVQTFQPAPVQTFQPAPVQNFQPAHVEEAPRHEAPIITKQFYLHSAPEDHESVQKTKHFVLGRAQKNYRVVFIKAPSSSNANVKLSAEYAPQEEKTVIYVLSQKEHELDVNDIATPAPTQPSKPEVFFIKYKTPEEAAHAQQEIQNQYNVLGGQSQVSDEGTAPVSSVIGSLGQGEEPAASNNHGAAAYLPPHH